MARVKPDRVRFATATTGTGSITPGAAISSLYLTPTDASLANNDKVVLLIQEGGDFELVEATYTTGPEAFSRDTVKVSKIGSVVGTTRMTLGGNAIASIVEVGDDFKASEIDFTPASGIAAADVQGAIEELADAVASRAGVFFHHGGSTPPTGALARDGAAVAVATYPELTTAIYCGDGNNATADWGYRTTSQVSPSTNRSTTGDYIVLPDSRGDADRGWDDGRGVDSGRALNDYQDDAVQDITGNFTIRASTAGTGVVLTAGGAFERVADDYSNFGGASTGSSTPSDRITFDASEVVRTASETRMRNTAGLACIWYE